MYRIVLLLLEVVMAVYVRPMEKLNSDISVAHLPNLHTGEMIRSEIIDFSVFVAFLCILPSSFFLFFPCMQHVHAPGCFCINSKEVHVMCVKISQTLFYSVDGNNLLYAWKIYQKGGKKKNGRFISWRGNYDCVMVKTKPLKRFRNLHKLCVF